MGYDYENGYRTNQDLKQAYFWYGVAARHGANSATVRLHQVSESLQPEDRKTLDRDIERWQAVECDLEIEQKAESAITGPISPNTDAESYWLAYVNRGHPELDRLRSLCRAADLGHQTARLRLAQSYWFGNYPILQDRTHAQMWLILAARDGGQFAKNQTIWKDHHPT